MSRKYLTFLLLSLSIVEFANAKSIVDCRIIVGGTSKCNQYSSKLIRAKEILYDTDTKKLIISKTLPVPKKATVKVISVADMIEKYVKVEDSLRFRGTHEKTVMHDPLPVRVVDEIVDKYVIEKMIESIPKVTKSEENLTVDKIVKSEENLTIDKIAHIDQSKIKELEKPEKIYGIYKVVSGDGFSQIGYKFGVKRKELLELNDLTNQSILRIGQKFKIPFTQKMIDDILNAEYTIEDSDTLSSIAYKFNIKPKKLAQFNHIKTNSKIKVGKKLALPLPYVLKKIKADKEKKELKKFRTFAKRKLRVTATAYTSHANQTDSTPFIAAWNNRLRPGMKIIAVSRDMLTRYGMRNGTKVRIGGLPGYYRVRDKMNKRYRKRIDIYTGLDRRKALRWGRRNVVIYW